MRCVSAFLVGLGIALGPTPGVHALDPSPKCEALRLKLVGKMQKCLMTNIAKNVTLGLPSPEQHPNVVACTTSFVQKWGTIVSKIEAKDPLACFEWIEEATIAFEAIEQANRLSRSMRPVRFQDNGDTITDMKTGLMWERKQGFGEFCLDPQCPTKVFSWHEANDEFLDHLNKIGGVGFAGYSNWRLPQAWELLTLSLAPECPGTPAVDPCIDETYFPDTVLGEYWTATLGPIIPGQPPRFLTVDFVNGDVEVRSVDGPFLYYVRAVRNAW